MTYLTDEYKNTLVNDSEDDIATPGDDVEEEIEEGTEETEEGEDLGEEVEGEEEI